MSSRGLPPSLLHGIQGYDGHLGTFLTVALNVVLIVDILACVLVFDGELALRQKLLWTAGILLVPVAGAAAFFIARARRPELVGA